MADRCGSAWCGCCRFCCSLIFTSGLTALFIWLSLRTSNPKCSLEDFYITDPSMNSNHNISLKLKFENVMKDKDVRYDDLNLTLLYFTQNTSEFIGNTTMKSFKQGHSKKAHKEETILANGFPSPWNKTGLFGLTLSTKVKFKIMFWYTKKHHWHFQANVTVDHTGKRSDASALRPICYHALLGFFLISCFNFKMFA